MCGLHQTGQDKISTVSCTYTVFFLMEKYPKIGSETIVRMFLILIVLWWRMKRQMSIIGLTGLSIKMENWSALKQAIFFSRKYLAIQMNLMGKKRVRFGTLL